MKAGIRLFLLFVGVGLLLWVADAAIDYYLFYPGSFLDLLVLAVPPHELYVRSLILLALVLLGGALSWHITRRRKAERALRRSKQALEASEREKVSILDSLTEMVTYQDTDLVIHWANRAALRNAEARRVDIIGRRCHEAHHGRAEPCTECPVREALRTGEPSTGEVPAPEGRVWFVSARPVRDDAGRVVGVVESALDVTAPREAQQRVRSLARFPGENPAPVLRIADDGRVLYANAPAQGVLEALGSGPDRPAPEAWRAEVRQALAAGDVRRVEVSHADRTYALRFVPVSDAGYVNLYGEDITQRKRAEEERDRHLQQLVERNKELRCLYGVSRITTNPDVPLDGMLQEAVEHIPAGRQYPEVTCARILLDDRTFESTTFRETPWMQTADIVADGRKRGTVEVGYREERPEADEGPFLREERALIDNLAVRLGEALDRHEAEQEVRESHGRLLQAQRHARIGSWEWDAPSGEVWWSEETYRLFGLSPESYCPTYERHLELIPEADRNAYERSVEEALAGKEPFEYEFPVDRPDGRRVVLLVRGDVQVDQDGVPVGMAGTVMDITEHKRAEAALRESEERFRRAVGEAPFPIILHAEDGEVLTVNQAWTELTGYTHADIPTIADWTERAYGERKERVRADIDRLYELDRAVDEGEYVIICRDGTKRTWAFSSGPLPPLPDGRRLVISMAADVTQRKEAEAEVRQLASELDRRVRRRTAELAAANRELEAFAYSVSHDLRAPLRSMDGFSEALLDEYAVALDETGRDYLRRIRAGAQRMGTLIDDLLTLSRATRGEMRHETVNLSAEAQALLARMHETEPERDVEIHVDEGLAAEGDRRLLRHVLQNLLGNAWKFTRDAQSARVTFRRLSDEEAEAAGADGRPVFAVEDNGVGFDPKYADKVFQVFQRLHGRDEFPGTGVGLATVQRIVHRHGGRVWAEGRPGEGAAFYFTLG